MPKAKHARGPLAPLLRLSLEISPVRLLSSVPIVTVADQALISGCNFISAVILVRSLGLEGYGHYVLLYAALQYLNTFCGALIVSPMMSLAPLVTDERARRRLLRGAFGWQALLSLFLSGAALIAGLAYQAIAVDWSAAAAIVPFSVAVFAFQMQDWFRRYHFVRQRPERALRSDLLAYGGMLAILGITALADALDVYAVFVIISTTFIAAALIETFVERILPTRVALRDAFNDGRHAARDYLLAWQLMWAATQGILFVGASFLGAEAAGAIRATQILLGPLTVAFQALDNILPVRAGIAYRSGGLAGMQAELRLLFFRFGTPLLTVLLLLGLCSGTLMRILFGASFEAFAVLVVWQCLYFLLQYALRFLQIFHRTLNDTRVIVQSSLISASTALLVALVAVPKSGEVGVVTAWSLATTVTIVFLAWRAKGFFRGQS